jgi:hypothetical protein
MSGLCNSLDEMQSSVRRPNSRLHLRRSKRGRICHSCTDSRARPIVKAPADLGPRDYGPATGGGGNASNARHVWSVRGRNVVPIRGPSMQEVFYLRSLGLKKSSHRSRRSSAERREPSADPDGPQREAGRGSGASTTMHSWFPSHAVGRPSRYGALGPALVPAHRRGRLRIRAREPAEPTRPRGHRCAWSARVAVQ